MEKLEINAPERGVQLAKPEYDDLKGCCPPMSSSLLKDLIDPKPYDDVNDDYKLVFESIPFFENLMQRYLDYISLIYPCVDKLVFHWALYEKGTGNAPSGSTFLEETWNWFVPAGGGVISGNTNFFSQRLVENTWYTVDLGIYTGNCNAFANQDCQVDYSFNYRWQLT